LHGALQRSWTRRFCCGEIGATAVISGEHVIMQLHRHRLGEATDPSGPTAAGFGTPWRPHPLQSLLSDVGNAQLASPPVTPRQQVRAWLARYNVTCCGACSPHLKHSELMAGSLNECLCWALDQQAMKTLCAVQRTMCLCMALHHCFKLSA
jgi:hypothetical protein